MIVEFIRQFQNCNNHARLLSMVTFSDGTQMPVTNEIDGRGNVDGTYPDGDIVSDEPIREPVEVIVKKRFVNIYEDWSICAHASMEAADSNASTRRIGVYELPEKILVTPK
jgi:hypothetical protein